MNKIGILILNWNGHEIIGKCLDSIVNQKFFGDIIVIDNMSNDDSVNIINQYKDVKLISNPENYGYAKGYNIGINKVINDYDFLFLINNDTILKDGVLKEIQDKIDNIDDKTGMLACKMTFQDESMIDNIGIQLHKSGLGFNNIDLKNKIIGPSGGAGIYRCSMLKNIFSIFGEYFDELFEFYSEDLDLAYRARLLGWNCEIYDNINIIHLHSVSTKKRGNKFSLYFNQRNQIYFIIKNYSISMFFKYFFYIFSAQFLEMLLHILKGNFVTIIKAKYDSIKELRSVWNKHKLVQKNIKISKKQVKDLFSEQSLYKLWKK